MTKLPPPPPPPHKVALVTYLACQLKMERSHQTHVPFITTPSLLTLMLHFFPLDMQRLCPTLVLLINIAPTHQSSQCLSFTVLVLFIHFLPHTERIWKKRRTVHLRLYGMAIWHFHNCNVPVFIFLPIGQCCILTTFLCLFSFPLVKVLHRTAPVWVVTISGFWAS